MPLLSSRIVIQCWDEDAIADEMVGSIQFDINNVKKLYAKAKTELYSSLKRKWKKEPKQEDVDKIMT
jgi:hypothetical protein